MVGRSAGILGGYSRNPTGLVTTTNHPVSDSLPESPSEDLAGVLELVAQGDLGAFRTVYDATSLMVFGIAVRLLRDWHLAQEASQEIYLEVWRYAPRYQRSLGSPHSWIATIAHRRAVDVVRRTQRRRDRCHLEQSVQEATVDDTAAAWEMRATVRQALADLSDKQRIAVTLAYFDGLTQSEIARRLDVPLGTVKTRIRDALIRLRVLMDLDDEWDE